MQNTNQAFAVGAVLENFGAIVRVVEVDAERGLLVEMLRVVNGRKQKGGGRRYYAAADRCRLVVEGVR